MIRGMKGTYMKEKRSVGLGDKTKPDKVSGPLNAMVENTPDYVGKKECEKVH